MAGLISKEEASEEASIHVSESRIKGIVCPGFVFQEEELEKYAASLTLYPSDVWIITFPKAGTTWTQQIVKLIRNGGESDAKNVTESSPWLEEKVKVDIESLTKPRSIKTHLPYELMPCGIPSATPCKYVYVARNPKDVAASWYHHYRLADYIPGLEWGQFFRYFVQGKLYFGDYFDHVLSWWAHKDDDNVLFIKYEDMKKDLPAAVASIAKFIECDITDEVIAKVAAKTSFDVMKNDNTANYSWLAKDFEKGFMRKGEVGDWKNYFTPEQSAEMDKIYHERLGGSGLEFNFGDTL